MAFNEFEDRGLVHVISDDSGQRLYVRAGMFGDTLAISMANEGCLFGDDERESLRAFANAVLRWCDTGGL